VHNVQLNNQKNCFADSLRWGEGRPMNRRIKVKDRLFHPQHMALQVRVSEEVYDATRRNKNLIIFIRY
jgi:hypothetical protein